MECIFQAIIRSDGGNLFAADLQPTQVDDSYEGRGVARFDTVPVACGQASTGRTEQFKSNFSQKEEKVER